jgi:hypothetical protein
MTSLKKTLSLAITLIIVFFVCNDVVFAYGEPIEIYTNDYTASGGGVAFNFYPSGYSDGFWWGYTNRHPYYHHEMLSGEHAAAIWWNNCGSNQAIWLPDQFVEPDFSTNSTFQAYGNPPYLAWNDPCNPIDSCDTAYSVIRDTLYDQNSIEVRIDYELVDLGQQDTNGVGGSPMAFRDASGTVAYVYSDPCVLLQTYTIKNISDSNITGLEFYQMLCGLSSVVYYSSYAAENYSDPLSNYIPHNPVHKAPGSNYAGKFRYDVSQWGYGDPNTDHVDWIGISSTIPPDSYDTSTFPYASPPTTGTYIHVMNRSLNNQTYIDGGYVAGAMKWNLGNLEPNHTVKRTIAVMFGCGPVNYTPPTPVVLTKTDNIGICASPFIPEIGNYVNYTICYDACGFSDTNVVLVDYLPAEVDFNYASDDGVYDSDTNTVTWSLGTMGPNDTNCFNLQVKLNSNATQGLTITNLCELTGDNFSKQATKDTNVCCINNKVYVDKDANGANNGANWQNAYKELRDAIANVKAGNQGCANQIWVAKGTYKSCHNKMLCDFINGLFLL